nr:MAG TPA: hypothetical protein [Caudoviricetes sp.]
MKVLSHLFGKLSANKPMPILREGDYPWDPPIEIERSDIHRKLLVSPDRQEARLISGKIAEILAGHWRTMYLPGGGTIDLVQNEETWRLALELLAVVEKIDVMVKPDQELFGSGATVHYPKGGNYAVFVGGDEGEDAK